MLLMRSKISVIFYTFFITLAIYGQPLMTEKLTIGDGLSNARVHDIIQDSYGLIWIGTNDGLNVYDGYTFKVFKNVPGNPTSIQSNIIWSVVEDHERNIWVATETGVSKYIRKENSFINYELSEYFPSNSGTDFRTLDVLVDSSNSVWATTLGLDIIHFDKNENSWQKIAIEISDSSYVASQATAIDLELDQNNMLWAGSFRAGLVWYDKVKNVFRQAEYGDKISNPNFTATEHLITKIFSDPTGILWITTRNGIFKYNPQNKTVKKIKQFNVNKDSFWNYFNDIVQDQQGNLWITNNQRGVFKFDGISDDYKQIIFNGQNINREGLSDIIFTRAFKDHTGIMWLGTITDGLLKYDYQRAPFKYYHYDPQKKNGISTNQVFALCESSFRKGKIFVGTRGGGLNLFDTAHQAFSRIPYEVREDNFGGSVRSVLEEKDGSLWLGTWGDGLLKMTNDFKVVKRFVNDTAAVNTLPDQLIRVIKNGPGNNLWIGTNNGLALLNKDSEKIKRVTDRTYAVYPQDLIDIIKNKRKSDSNTIALDKVANHKDLSSEFTVIKPRNYLVIASGEGRFSDSTMYDFGWITDARNNEIWTMGNINKTYYLGGDNKNRIQAGLLYLKPGTYKLRYKSDDSHCFNNWNSEPPAYLDLWGIQIFEISDKSELDNIRAFLKTTEEQKYIKGSNIRSIHVSLNNIIWIGSDQQGLNRYDWNKQTVKTYAYDLDNPQSISNNSVQYIYEDADGILWLATNNGLNRFDPVKETFSAFSEEDGLPTNYIASILPGDNGELWLATRNGISKMVTDKSTGKITFVNYDASDGLGGTDFIALVALKSRNGRFYFGGEHGLNVFTPGEANMMPPGLILSDLKVSNISVLSGKSETTLDTSLYDLQQLDLPYDKNDLSFEFSALHYSNPLKNQYAHIMQGYDTEWIYDNSRKATYTNLDPGHYTFSFKGTNRDGIWNEQGRFLSIIIHPPWWQTIWAYIGYGLLLIGTIFTVDRYQRRRLLAKAKERMRLQEAEHRAEAAELRAQLAESENERKTKELEEARALQLSMLPKELPQLPHLDIAVYMQTATEVGGDYYDFHVSMDGILTVVIGDATGHGMKAGTMVTAAKSLFNSYAPNPDILFSFKEITRCIKQMNFEKLSMCMTMLKIKGNKLQMSTAGMPPSFIFRRDTKVMEEHLFKAMPLGTMEKFPYELKDTTLKPGDTILLMSDGLPELENAKGDMYGYKRIRNGFEEVAEKSPEDIINFLKNEGAGWVNNEDPDDDVTFVVIKVK